MIEEIFRKYLEIKSINDLNEVQKPPSSYSLNLIETKDFQLNKFNILVFEGFSASIRS